MKNTNTKGDAERLSNTAALSRLFSDQDLRDVQKNIADLGEDYQDYSPDEDPMEAESMPKKNLVYRMAFETSGSTLTSEVVDKKVNWEVARPGSLTMFDIVNDRKSGMPTHSEVSPLLPRSSEIERKTEAMQLRGRLKASISSLYSKRIPCFRRYHWQNNCFTRKPNLLLFNLKRD